MKSKMLNKSNQLKSYTVLYWFWNEDNMLNHEYIDCYLSLDTAIECAKRLRNIDGNIEIYMPDDIIPNHKSGEFGSPSFIQILEKIHTI